MEEIAYGVRCSIPCACACAFAMAFLTTVCVRYTLVREQCDRKGGSRLQALKGRVQTSETHAESEGRRTGETWNREECARAESPVHMDT